MLLITMPFWLFLLHTLDGQSEYNSLTQVIDPKERKRQRERARRAAMTEKQRNEINSKKRRASPTEEQLSEINRKRRETYHRKKAKSMLSKVSKGNCIHYEIVQIQFPFFVQPKCIIYCVVFLRWLDCIQHWNHRWRRKWWLVTQEWFVPTYANW